MSNILSEFPKYTFNDWKNQLMKDLKGEPEDSLVYKDSIEEFEYPCYQHQDTVASNNKTLEEISDFRISSKTTNDWFNFGTVIVGNDIKKANKHALTLLDLGADALRFIFPTNTIVISDLVNEIQLEFIKTSFVIQTFEQFKALNEYLSDEAKLHASIEIDLIRFPELKNHLQELTQANSKNSFVQFVVNGYEIQQRGATTWQEVGFCLATAHEYINLLVSDDFSLDNACKAIVFNVGAGSNYFYEIAKLKVLAETWQYILHSYDKNQFNHSKTIGIVGFTNKSIKDPYTNLLRQTTEAMSLISGGVNGLVVQSYNLYSTNGITDLAERMALNIPTILKEESYFNAVIDPLAGSYSINLLCDLISSKSWAYFKELEKLNGISAIEAQNKLKQDIELKANERIARINSKKDVIIGVNIFKNGKDDENDWIEFPSYLGLKQLILENQFEEATV